MDLASLPLASSFVEVTSVSALIASDWGPESSGAARGFVRESLLRLDWTDPSRAVAPLRFALGEMSLRTSGPSLCSYAIFF